MAIRKRAPKAMGGLDFVLANGAVAEQGAAAGIDTATGTVKPMQALTTLVFIGFFELGGGATSLTGDGTKEVHVRFPEALVYAEWLANDSAPNDVQAGTVGSEVYYKDAATVSTLSTGRSKAGRVIRYDSVGNRVLVQGGLAVTGPTGAGGVAHSVADRTALKAIGADSRFDGMTVLVRSDNALFRFNSAASFTSDENEMIGATPAAGTGRWVRADKSFIAKLPIAFGTLDAAALLTVPAGFALRLSGMPFWDIVTGFTGGSSSAIGLSCSAIATTKGDLLGGAAGDIAATLVAGIIPGTIGPKIDSFAEVQAFIVKAADVLRFDRITSVFTAGAGFICVPVSLHQVG